MDEIKKMEKKRIFEQHEEDINIILQTLLVNENTQLALRVRQGEWNLRKIEELQEKH